jgi:tetratricopeptide (TPR) repeat protein
VTGAERRQALQRAGVLADAGRLDDAVAVYGELLRVEPDDVQALCGLSRCLGKMGRPADGLELANRAAALAPASDWPHRLRSAHLLLLGRPGPALEAARAALAIDPSGFVAMLSVFEAQSALRKGRAAAETARAMVESHPGEPESHNAVGRAAMLRRNWQRAEASFREALRLAPQESVYQSNLAVALERRGRKQEAMQHFRRAVETDPGNATVRRQLAHAMDRRLAVAGVAGGLGAGVVVNVVRGFEDPAAWAVMAAMLALVVGVVLAVRWWRLRQFDETLRTFYRHEQRQLRALHREMAASLGLLVAACFGLLAVIAWLGRSWVVTLVATVVMALLLRYPGMYLWRREVLPRLQARHRALRAR